MLETLLTSYGYPLVLLGTLLEGETVLVMGGVAAHLGYLSLDRVIACGFCGTLASDQLCFFIGRRHGKVLLARHPAWQSRAERVMRRLERHQNLLILGFRFLYGLRSITPFAIGLSGVSYLHYTVLNAIGAGLWAVGIGLAGYYFGQAVEAILGDIRHYELALMGSIAAVGTLFWLVHIQRRRRRFDRTA
jgi:membrane protein DedA with SNARE-associated domain